MIVLDLPAFVMEVGDTLASARQITAYQTQLTYAAIFVRKDPAEQKDFVIEALEPTAHGLLVR